MADAPLPADLTADAPPGELPTSAPAAEHKPESPAAAKIAVERKLDRVRARLFSRIDEVGRRVRKVKSAVDVMQIVRDHPFAAVGIGLAAGALVGLPRISRQGVLGTQLTGLVTGLATQAVKASVGAWILAQVRGASADH
jgi:ElaB/YqjD/DUF883 family membrane-anchored ribosome-binding protein